MDSEKDELLENGISIERASTGNLLDHAFTSSDGSLASVKDMLKAANDDGMYLNKKRLFKTLVRLVCADAVSTSVECCLPLILRLMNFPNPDFQILGCLMVAKYAKIFSEEDLEAVVPHLISLTNFDSCCQGISFMEVSALAIKNLAKRGRKFRILIGQFGVFPALMNLASGSDEKVQVLRLQTLRELVISTKPNQEMFVQAGGLSVIFSLITSNVASVKCLSAEILGSLASLRSIRRAITSRSGVASLVEAARVGCMTSKARAAHALGLLAFSKRLRRIIGSVGGIDVLVQLLRDGDETTKLVAGNSLGIVSACMDHLQQVAQAGAIPLYMSLLEGGNPFGKDIAEDAFCVLAVSEDNALVIMERLVRVLRDGNAESKAAAADVLWDLSMFSISIILDAIPLLVVNLRDESDEVRENVSGVICQMSYNDDDRYALVEAGIIPILIELLQDGSLDVKSNATEALHNFAEDACQRSQILDALAHVSRSD